MSEVISRIKRHGRVSALKCMHESEPGIYTRAGELRLFYTIVKTVFFR